MKRTNEILEDHGDWLLVDISTPKFPDATMAVDKDVFEAYEGGRIYASKNSVKYICAFCNVGKKHYLFHRLVIECEGTDIDHINHGTMSFIDNRARNLRKATHSQNQINRGPFTKNKSGTPGVRWHDRDKIWEVNLRVDGKRFYIGRFDNIEFAIGARQQAEREYFGEYAFNAENA